MPYIDLRTVTMKDLPEKKKGRHRFIAIATFITSDESIRAGYEGTDVGLFDAENIWDFSFGCIDCEQPWSPDMKKYCSAPEYIDPKRKDK